MKQLEPYYHVTWTWWHYYSPKELLDTLKRGFSLMIFRRDEHEYDDMSPYKGYRWEILVKADSLSAFLSAYRAVLFQKVKAPFTGRDVELRTVVLTLFPHRTSAPFPWGFSHEPRFEVEM